MFIFRNFSPAVASDECRQSLVAKILAVYEQFDIDGIDIDWEYPGHEGNAGNQYSGSDTANFLSFFQLLRYTLPPAAIITAAVQTTTFVDAQSQPMKDVSEFAKVLDWALIMNYDAYGCKFIFSYDSIHRTDLSCSSNLEPRSQRSFVGRLW